MSGEDVGDDQLMGTSMDEVTTTNRLPPRIDKRLEFVGASPTPRRVSHVQFGVMTPGEVTSASQIEVSNDFMYDAADRSVTRGGALDPRLGAINRDATCETCHQKIASCAGHFGYVRLCLPVFHAGFFKSTLQILQMICKRCARVMAKDEVRERFIKRLRNPVVASNTHLRAQVLRDVWDKCKKVKICPFCGAVNGAVKKIGGLRIIHYPKGNKPPTKKRDEDDEADEFNASQRLYDPMYATVVNASADIKKHIGKAADDLNPVRALDLFERIPAEDVELLDMCAEIGRPERLIIVHLPVPPLCLRPTVCQDPSAGSTEDDLTVKASEIIETNNTIRAGMEKGLATGRVFEMWDHMQIEVAKYINSESPGIPKTPNAGKPIRGLSQRLKGKAGRFRGNLSGKRVDFSGRTVISPDPNLSIDQVGVPVHVAKILTYPQRVASFNIEMLRQCIRNGPEVHPGANFVKFQDGSMKFLKYGDREKLAEQLALGDLVERHLMDGDVVLFNRQPSLHRISIMCHRVRVGNHRTFRFNECVCSPYNADFDGDEMNLHVPQTEEARAEALELMSVLRNLITPRNGEPIVAAIQDFITAAYLITNKEIFMDRAEFYQAICMMSNSKRNVYIPPPCIIKPIALWSGKQIFTTLVRNAALNGDPQICSNVGKSEKEREEFFAALTTNVKEKGFSAAPSQVPQTCEKDGFVCFRAGELISGQVGKKSLGSGSKKSIFYILQREYGVDAAASAMTQLARLSARWLSDAGFSIGVDDVSPSEALRAKKNRLVHNGYADCEDIMRKFNDGELEASPGCTTEETLEALLNQKLSVIREDAGQACISEIDPTTNAALTMALCGSKGSNINISQMVSCVGQQTVGGSRAPDGFFGRALPHFELGIKAKSPVAKGFVANSFFSGMNPTEFFFHTMGGREGLVDTAVKTAETGYMQRRLMKALEDLSVQYDSTVRTSDGGVVQMRYGDDGLDPSEMQSDGGKPVNFAHLLESVRIAVPVSFDKMMSGKKMRKYAMKALEKKLIDVKLDPISPNYGIEYFLKSALDFLSSYAEKQEAEEQRSGGRYAGLDKNQIDAFIERMIRKLEKGEAEPGSAVGALGAQSIGEPGTQMTLKTFHFAGVASMNITQGVPRLKEIINASQKIATPIITAPLNVDNDVKVASIVKGRVERTFLGEISIYIKEVYRANQAYVAVKIDLGLIDTLGLEINLYQVAVRITEHKFKDLKVTADDVIMIRPDKLRIVARPRGDAWKTNSSNRPASETRKMVAANQPFYILQSLKSQLARVAVEGVSGVGRAVIGEVEKKDGNRGKKEKNYNLVVESADLSNVMIVQGIDGTKTTSNHLISVEETLGIEAARATIMKEIITTMESHGMTIDERHVKLLADCMTSGGTVLGITRFGIQKMKTSTLMLASFEMTVEHLFNAAVHARKDRVQGVSERIILGMPIPLGTGLFEMLRHSENHIHRFEPSRNTLLSDSLPTSLNL